SVRRAGARVPQGAADRSGSPERQRRRDRARPPARLHRREADDDAPARDETAQRALRHGDDLWRRRHVSRGYILDALDMAATTAPRGVSGGEWLLQAADADSVLTPERLSDEHRLIGQTTQEFVENEVLPKLDRLEAKDWGLARDLVKRGGELGLLGVDVP